MRKIPCELTLGNGGDVIVMVALDDDGVLHVPRRATYGTFEEGVLAFRVMKPEDQACVRSEIWVDSAGK
jgi:hypothetical protein